MLKRQRDLAGALAEYRAALIASQHLVDLDAENASWQQDLAQCHDKVGDVLLATDDLASALVEYRASSAIFKRLVDLHPENAGSQKSLALTHERVGGVLDKQGDPNAALAEYRSAAEILERLSKAEPDNPASPARRRAHRGVRGRRRHRARATARPPARN